MLSSPRWPPCTIRLAQGDEYTLLLLPAPAAPYNAAMPNDPQTPRTRLTRRSLVRLALLLLVLLAVAVLVGWRLAARSLRPDRDEVFETSGLAAEVTIAYDRWGVPHVRAASLADACFAQGWVHARDRFFQLELARRAAAGRLAELLGEAALPSDVRCRRWGLPATAAAQAAQLDGDTALAVNAYAAGVNAAVARFGAAGLAPELALLGGSVAAWTVQDTVGIGLLLERSLTWAAEDELRRAAELRALGTERAVALWGWSEEQRAAWLPAAGVASGQPGAAPSVPAGGSNNWAVSGQRSASGYPLLANDPHVGIANPATWYEVHLQAPGLAVAGASIPGAPGVVIGHNEALAWGFTMSMLDDQDLFRLTLSPDGRSELVDGTWRALQLHEETIPVRGRAVPEKLQVASSLFGPVVRQEGEEVLALAWTALRGHSPLPCFLRLDRAGSVEEGARAFADCEAPGMNLVMADRQGRIRWQVVGLVPLRGRSAGRLPSPGTDSLAAWQGWEPFQRNPYLQDPQAGFVASANHDPFAEGDFEGPPFSGGFAPPWRIRTIKGALAAREGWDVDACLALQNDVGNPEARALLQLLAPLLDAIGTAPARQLHGWDGRMDAQSREALLWAEFLRELQRRVGGDEAAAAGLAASPIGGQELLRLLSGSLDARWWDDVSTPAVESARQVVAAALAAAAARAGHHRWGERHRLLFAHPLGQLPLLGGLLNWGPYPASGAAPCCNATAYRAAGATFDVVWLPSLRFVADLADWDRAVFTLPLGQSGHFLSRHAADQVGDWLAGRAHPMAWSPAAVAAATVARSQLRPATASPGE
jgi:penicillin amidase